MSVHGISNILAGAEPTRRVNTGNAFGVPEVWASSGRISTYRYSTPIQTNYTTSRYNSTGYSRMSTRWPSAPLTRQGGWSPPTFGSIGFRSGNRLNLGPRPGGIITRPPMIPPTNPPPNVPPPSPPGGPGGNNPGGGISTTTPPRRTGAVTSAGGSATTTPPRRMGAGTSAGGIAGIIAGGEPGAHMSSTNTSSHGAGTAAGAGSMQASSPSYVPVNTIFRGLSASGQPATSSFAAAVANAASISIGGDQTETMQSSVQGSDPGTGSYSGDQTETMHAANQLELGIVSTAQGAHASVESTANANTEGGDANVPGPQTFPNQVNPNLVAAAQSLQGTPQPTNNNGKRAIIGANNNIISNCFGGSTGVNSTSVKPTLNISLTNKPTNNQSYKPGGCWPGLGTTGAGSSTGGVAVGTSRGQSGGNSLLSGTVTAGTAGTGGVITGPNGRVHIPLHSGPGGWFGNLGGKQGTTSGQWNPLHVFKA